MATCKLQPQIDVCKVLSKCAGDQKCDIVGFESHEIRKRRKIDDFVDGCSRLMLW